MTVHDGTTLELRGDRDIVITRAFNAPRALVWRALTSADLVKQWWAPASRGQMTLCEIDFRVGGRWRHVMRTREGHFEVGFSGEYLVIEPMLRIVNTEVFDPFPDAAATVVVELSERAGAVVMTSTSTYPTSAIRDQVIATGMEGGMRESMQQLTAVVAALG
jgi:uncharacterized protein YndB with AHSA1/START domain